MTVALVEELHRLCEARDLAAYRVVGCLEVAIYCCRNGNATEALKVLTRAKQDYEQANRSLEIFKQKNETVAQNSAV